MKRKLIASLLCLCMIVSLLPIAAFATGEPQEAADTDVKIVAGFSAKRSTVAADIKAATGMTAKLPESDNGSMTNYLWFVLTNLTANTEYTLSAKNGENEILTKYAIDYGNTKNTISFTTGNAQTKALYYVSLDETGDKGQVNAANLGTGGNLTVTVSVGNKTATDTIKLQKIGATWSEVNPEIAAAGYAWMAAAADAGFDASINEVRGTTGDAYTGNDAGDQSMWVVFNGLENNAEYTYKVTKKDDASKTNYFTNTFTASKADPAYIWTPLDARNSGCPSIPKDGGTFVISLYAGGTVDTNATALDSVEVTVPEYSTVAPTVETFTVSNDMKIVTIELSEKLRGEYKIELLKPDGKTAVGTVINTHVSRPDFTFTSANALEAGTYTFKVTPKNANSAVVLSLPIEVKGAATPAFRSAILTTYEGQAVSGIQTVPETMSFTANGSNIAVGGVTLKYVDSWTNFNTAYAAEQSGYYIGISVPKVFNGQTITKMVIPGKDASGNVVQKEIGANAFTEGSTPDANDYCDVFIHMGATPADVRTKTYPITLTYGTSAAKTYTLTFASVATATDPVTTVAVSESETQEIAASYANGTVSLNGLVAFTPVNGVVPTEVKVTLDVTLTAAGEKTVEVTIKNNNGTLTAESIKVGGNTLAFDCTELSVKNTGAATPATSAPAVTTPKLDDTKKQAVAEEVAAALTTGSSDIKFEVDTPDPGTTTLEVIATKAANEETRTVSAIAKGADAPTLTSEEAKTASEDVKKIVEVVNAAKADTAENPADTSTVAVAVTTYMAIEIADVVPVTNGVPTVTISITPMKQTVLTTATAAAAPGTIKVLGEAGVAPSAANAVPVGDPVPVSTTKATPVKIPVPSSITDGAYVIKHEKKDGNKVTATYYYDGTVTSSGTKILAFNSVFGFSDFTIMPASADPRVAVVNDAGFDSLAKAIEAASEGGTITLKNIQGDKSVATVNLPEGKTVKFEGANGTLTINDVEYTVATGGTTVTIPAKTTSTDPETPSDPDSSSTGGGGSSASVSVPSAANGKVTVSNSNAKKGDTVTITLTPNTGYVVDTVTVTDSKGNAVEVSKTDDTHYTFVMPDGRVTVKATFKQADTPPATGFTDVPADAYYADAVKWAVDNGITNGLTATTFGPNNSCTRGQMVTFLWRAAGSPAATGTNSFSDVASGEYYYNAVLWAVEKGITNGTSATTFSPNATVNRGQTVTFLYRYAESPAATGDTSFTDVAADAFYADAVKWAVAEGITNGTSDTTFAPASNCTRGQIVTFMYRQMAE